MPSGKKGKKPSEVRITREEGVAPRRRPQLYLFPEVARRAHDNLVVNAKLGGDNTDHPCTTHS